MLSLSNFLFHLVQTPKKETFHPEILKKSNHILRNCKNADIGILLQLFYIPEFGIFLQCSNLKSFRPETYFL